MIGLTLLTTNGRSLVAPKLSRRRAVFVLSKIEEILSWEKATDRERDSKFVELGRYLCEVRAGQYWRVDNVRSFDEFLERKFPESRRKASSKEKQTTQPIAAPSPKLSTAVHADLLIRFFGGGFAVLPSIAYSIRCTLVINRVQIDLIQ